MRVSPDQRNGPGRVTCLLDDGAAGGWIIGKKTKQAVVWKEGAMSLLGSPLNFESVCNGINGTNGGVSAGSVEPAGANCLYGGVKYTSSTGSNYVCNGANGTNGNSVTGASEPAGANCLNGGVKYVSASGTNYVCNGPAGTNGTNGTNGTHRWGK